MSETTTLYDIDGVKKWVVECDKKGFVIDGQRHNIIKSLLCEIDQLRAENERLNKERNLILKMIRDEDDKYGIGNMLSQWTADEVVDDIEERLRKEYDI